MHHSFPYLAQRIFNVPIAIHPEKAEIIVSALGERLGVTNIIHGKGNSVRMGFYDDDDYEDRGKAEKPKGYDLKDGIAIIHISGTLVHKNGGCLRPSSGMTGYDGIRQNISDAMEDPAVRAIALDIDSPGGEVSGCFDLVDMIYELRGEKFMMAILSECAFSAAYAIASACDFIAVPRTGGVGSIGVVAMHVDYSEALENAGLKVTFIQYGAHKTDGTEARPLSGAAQEKMQADVNTMGDFFVNTVARNRGLSPKKIRDTEAATFLGEAGVKAELADAVLAPDEAMARLISSTKKPAR